MIKLNVGAGEDCLGEYINIDIRNLEEIDIISDLSKCNLPFLPKSVDEIKAIDVIEHFSHKTSIKVLKYLISLLKKGGLIFIQCPDVLKLYEILKDNPRELIRRLYGDQDYPENTHKTGFTLLILEYLFVELGLEIVDKNYINGNLRIKGRKL